MPLLPAETPAPVPDPIEGLTSVQTKKKGRPYNKRKETAERSQDLQEGITAIKLQMKEQADKLAKELNMYVLHPRMILSVRRMDVNKVFEDHIPMYSPCSATRSPRRKNRAKPLPGTQGSITRPRLRKRAVSHHQRVVFGAFVLTYRYEGTPLSGRGALMELARSEAMKLAADSDDDDIEEQLKALEKHREENKKPKRWVKESQINADATHVFQKCVKEVCV